MGRLWLVLAMLVALAGTALAKRDPPCTCNVPRVLPAPGSVDVPTNARLWRLPSTSAPDQPIASYALAPHTHYAIRDGGTSFTTGAGPDDSTPVEPGLAMVSVTLAGAGDTARTPVSILHVTSVMAPDVAVVRLTFADAVGEVTYYTTPDALSVCDPGIALTAGPVRVTLTALDLAGHASLEQTLDTTAYRDSLYDPRCVAPARCGSVGTLALAALVLGLCIIVLAVITARVRRHHRSAQPPEAMALPAAEALARAVRLRAVAALTILGATGGYAATHDNALVAMLVIAPALIAFAGMAISRVVEATRALGLLRYDGVTALVQRDRVEVAVGNRRVVIRATRWHVDRARRHALPKATL